MKKVNYRKPGSNRKKKTITCLGRNRRKHLKNPGGMKGKRNGTRTKIQKKEKKKKKTQVRARFSNPQKVPHIILIKKKGKSQKGEKRGKKCQKFLRNSDGGKGVPAVEKRKSSVPRLRKEVSGEDNEKREGAPGFGCENVATRKKKKFCGQNEPRAS